MKPQTDRHVPSRIDEKACLTYVDDEASMDIGDIHYLIFEWQIYQGSGISSSFSELNRIFHLNLLTGQS